MNIIRNLFKSVSKCPMAEKAAAGSNSLLEQPDYYDNPKFADKPAAPVVFEPKSPEFVHNPYVFFEQWRPYFPVFRAPSSAWVVTRYRDVASGFTDKRLGNAPSPFAVVHSRNKEKYICADVASNIIPYMDAPQHNGPRRIIARAFHSFINQNPPPAAQISRDLIHTASDQGQMDIVSDYGTPLSLSVMCNLLGLPLEDQQRLKKWTESFFYLFASMPSEEIRRQVDQALTEFRDYLRQVIEDKRRSPSADLLSALIVAEDQGSPLSEAELIDNTMLLFADGIENVDRGIGNMIHALLSHPEQWRLLKSDHELVPKAVDECLRFESPAQFVGKVALEDIEWHGQQIKKHSGVLLMIGSANRDPEVFPDPDDLKITRDGADHIAFGKGRHSCVGALLVRLQMEAALRALLDEARDLKLLSTAVEWEPRLAHRWIKHVSVQFSI